jgi:1-acyl-sn-glycerol-3-phosphate acyltransferase
MDDVRRRIGQALPSPGAGGFAYHSVRLGLRLVTSAYVRVSVEGAHRLPTDTGYIVAFNHPSWLDPIVLAAWWPDLTRLLYIFGPREQDMSVGLRNRLITWTGRGVPFQPGGADALDATRRSLAVLRAGGVLAIAGEGRLSDHEGDPLPFEPGVGHFAKLAKVPVVPLSVDGTRWVSFRSQVRLVIGAAVDPADFQGGRAAALALASAVRDRVVEGLAGVSDRPRPGPLGAWISEAFNDRPWLDEPSGPASDDGSIGRHPGRSP